jgi:predicted MFS family arabinose efflux permease
LAGAGPGVVGAFFALYGVMGLTGNTVATAVVSSLGTQRTLALFMGSTFLGLILWSLGAGWLVVMGAGIMCWGFGFAAINSMQQARLAAAAPDLASVSIALNTSVLYVGQAVGSGIGGLLFAGGHLHGMGYVGVVFMASAWIPLALTWERKAKFARVSAP